MKYFTALFSVMGLTSAQCSPNELRDITDLFIVFDHSHKEKELEATRFAWAAGVRQLIDWTSSYPMTPGIHASYARVADVQADICWVQDTLGKGAAATVDAIEKGLALSDYRTARNTFNAAGTWLFQNYWKQLDGKRRILFIATHNEPRHDSGLFMKFSPEILANPTAMCPLKQVPLVEQELGSLRKAKAGVFVVCFPHMFDLGDIYRNHVDFFKKNDFTDVLVLPKPASEAQITSDVFTGLQRMVCPHWTRTTTTMAPCKTKDDVIDCLLNEIDRSRFPNTYVHAMMAKCFIPSCYDWDTAFDCAQQIDKNVSCNWLEDLFSCIEN